MSAYVVSNETINCIVNAMIKHGLITRNDAVEVGQTLFDENVKSVNYRYSESDDAPVYKFTEKSYEPLQIFGCLSCWQYQSCEYEGCEDGEGWKLTDKMFNFYPLSFKDMDYPWGLD